MTKVTQKMEPQNAGEFKGTKGEWKMSPYAIHKNSQGNAWVKLVTNQPPHSATIIAEVLGINREEAEANAKLIAASKDLLEYAQCDLMYEKTGLFFLNGFTYKGREAQLQLGLMRGNAIKKATS